ncbi:hypothetical protein I3760_07G042900 [Carya illinoinensis]|nr:hypothetical protein I3760_07G042900 [Carya illinoinensis]
MSYCSAQEGQCRPGEFVNACVSFLFLPCFQFVKRLLEFPTYASVFQQVNASWNLYVFSQFLLDRFSVCKCLMELVTFSNVRNTTTIISIITNYYVKITCKKKKKGRLIKKNHFPLVLDVVGGDTYLSVWCIHITFSELEKSILATLSTSISHISNSCFTFEYNHLYV